MVFAYDVNINYQADSFITAQFLNKLNEFSYLSTIEEPTRVTSFTKICTDYIFLKSKIDNFDSILPIVLKRNITDHLTAVLYIVLSIPK